MSGADERYARDTFLAMLAHELRQPLAPIQTALEIMRQRPSREAGERARRTIERQTAQLGRLVEDLVDYASAQRGLLKLRPEPVNLRQVLEAAIEIAQPTIRYREQTLQIELPPDPIVLHADPARLTQVFANLLNNAARFTEPGAVIGILVAAGEESATVRVRDMSEGISTEMLRDIFKLFVNAEQQSRWPGVGIGLSVVRTVVELHGGSVEVHGPADGRGAEFVIALPLTVEGITGPGLLRAHSESDPRSS